MQDIKFNKKIIICFQEEIKSVQLLHFATRGERKTIAIGQLGDSGDLE